MLFKLALLSATVSTNLFIPAAEARVEGGGAVYRGGNVMNRTPTMSRSNISSQPPANRQQTSVRLQQVVRQNSAGQNFDHAKLSQLQSDFNKKLPERQQNNRQVADRVRNQLQNRPHFNSDFFNRHQFHPNYYRSGSNWGAAVTWAGINSWLGWGWGSPYYYDSSGDYYDVTAPEYAAPGYMQPVVSQPSSQPVPAQTVAQVDTWMPLGVFALGQNAEQASASHRFLQLAMNREGEIEGTYYNSLSDKTYNVTGIVDKATQQVVFQLADNPDSPIATTGLFNLTEDQASLKVQFSDGSDQIWTMVRLEG